MSEKHTPGPWGVIAQSEMPESLRLLHVDGSEANARLIAAAPELLEACRNAKEVFDQWDGKPGKIEQRLDAAIAKAEGKP